MKMFIASVIVAVFLLAGALVKAQTNGLPLPVEKVLIQYGLPKDSLGIFIQDVTGVRPLLTWNENKSFNPASTIKLLTTWVALDVLGPAYTWKTFTYVQDPIQKGHLLGDLTLKGEGDPFLVTEYFWKFLHGLHDRGLRHIAGDLIIDNSFFAPLDGDPGAFDDKPWRPYNAVPNALMLNFQSIRFNFFPEPGSGRIRIVPDPWPANLVIQNHLKLIGGRCRGFPDRIKIQVSDSQDSRTIKFLGDYPYTCGHYGLYYSVIDSPALVFGVFKSLWQEMGGTIDGRLRIGRVSSQAKPFYFMTSPPLAELIRSVNKFSNNVMARQLLLTLAAQQKGAPATLEKGRAAVSDWLKAHGLNFPELNLDNGAGLSRTTQIASRSLGQLLLLAYRSPYMPEFMASLPMAGVDGTLRRRFKGEPLTGRLHMKTGTLDDVKAIAGYMLSRSGRRFVVVLLQNYPGVHLGAGVMVENALLRWLFEY